MENILMIDFKTETLIDVDAIIKANVVSEYTKIVAQLLAEFIYVGVRGQKLEIIKIDQKSYTSAESLILFANAISNCDLCIEPCGGDEPDDDE